MPYMQKHKERFLVQCMGLKPVEEEILPFLWYLATLAAAVLPCRSFQTSAQSLDFAATDLVKKVWVRHTESHHTPLLLANDGCFLEPAGIGSSDTWEASGSSS